ncbi:MAG: aspartate--tRNA ligase [Chitinophagales bacterium]|nr:aspartate--tRNA ligase [Chitinophagales bacterium]MDW8428670.1 aspartate--tRNA ligase [Chitinophagales bacterium]
MHATTYRTHTCGDLRLSDAGKEVTLCGWVFRIRPFGGMTFVDLRDRYGITQLVFSPQIDAALARQAEQLGREDVLQITGQVVERSNKNPALTTGDIEVRVTQLRVLNTSRTPPFTLEDQTDGGEELRMKYRYLDLRRRPLQQNLLLRHQVARAVREFLDSQGFVEIETPHLIKSTPEGARDFVVPSRLNPGQFYALPQSPQTFKQLLMVSGFDRYYQIVRCFRDEDLRQDRQPEFTQIDCEMAFVSREDVLQMFEQMVRHVFRRIRHVELPEFPRMSYAEAIRTYGTDKPDLRFGMTLHYLKDEHANLLEEHHFPVLDQAEVVAGISVPGAASFTRKQLDELTDFVRRPQIGAGGLIHIRWLTDNTIKSSIDKYVPAETLLSYAAKFEAKPGDLILLIAGQASVTRRALSELRLELGRRLGLRAADQFMPVWIVDFPLLEFDEQQRRWAAMHHPFTSWHPDDDALLETEPAQVRANAYDLVLNGVEIGGGSIRIHNRTDQMRMFRRLGLSEQEAEQKFGFILNAFEYGAPPHGGIAFGFDRFCSMVIANQEGIRDFIAFPKNNMGRDVMLDAPSDIDPELKKELGL